MQEFDLIKKWLKHRESRFKAIIDGLNVTMFRKKKMEFEVGEYSSYLLLRLDDTFVHDGEVLNGR